jgi:hypothetical protein
MKMRLVKTAAHVLKDAMTVPQGETTDATTAARPERRDDNRAPRAENNDETKTLRKSKLLIV